MRKLITALLCLLTGCHKSGGAVPAAAGGAAADPDAWVEQLVWRPVSDEQNPFDYEVLDCRAVALGFTATTADKRIAESFNRLRSDDGTSCIGKMPENSFSVDSDLRFPYNGKREDGVIFTAKQMEDKWDFFVYDSRLYIRRSWTGVLLHVAELRYTDSEVIVEKIHSEKDTVYGDPEFLRAHVQFLITTHFGQKLMPFPIPPGMRHSDTKAIALAGFSSYGSRAQYAASLTR